MTEEKATFCRICEPLCGMVVTVEDGKLVSLRADADNPHSKGFCCAKGVAMVEVQNDPDRLLHPLKRVGGPGEFERVSWDEALDDIAGRFRRLRDAYGPKSIAVHMGNPPYFSYSAVFWAKGFQDAVGTPWWYGVNSEDGASSVAATKLLFGACGVLPIPDYRRTDALMIIGANPWVSKGSFLHDPRMREHISGVVERGGRVFVVDPRRTETAQRFEHVPLRAGTDAWFLLSVLQVLFDEGLCDDDFLARHTTGVEVLRGEARRFPPNRTEPITGVPAETVRDIARTLGRARAAVVYGRTGTCTQRFGTLNNVLHQSINVVTGNIQTPGGWVFGWSPIPTAEMSEKMGLASYDKTHTRVSGLPDSFGFLPSSALYDEIMVPGDGQIRAIAMIGSNSVVSGPSGQHLVGALESLDSFFAIDLYVNETNKYADYVLPCTTMYEREDIGLQFFDRFIRPSLQVTEAIVDPAGECRPEWRILDDLAARMGLGGAYSQPVQRFLAKRTGLRIKPRQMADLLLRTGKAGDWFGLRPSGWSWKKLAERAPHGVVLHEDLPLRPLKGRLQHSDRKIHLAEPRVIAEVGRLEREAQQVDLERPYRLIGLREVRSHNSWMHNSARLMPDNRRLTLRIHPDDAAALGLADGDDARIASVAGEVVVPVTLTDEMIQGTVALPHGWGHAGGWSRANAAGGVTSNFLASSRPEDVEALSGSTVLNGIPVRIEPAVTPREAFDSSAEPAAVT
jgi:anaerobic selenocysteine-containing dehydrogenase